MKKIFVAAFTALLLSACNDAANNATTASHDSADSNTTGTNSEEAKEVRNKQTALASIEGFRNGGNLDVILKDIDKDVVDYGEGSMAPLKSVDSIKANLKMWMAAVPDYKGTDFVAVADGDYVMVYGTWTGTWKNDLMGMKATGKAFKVKDVDIFKFNEAGKIVEHRGVQSNYEAARQLGMKLPNS